MNTSRFEDITSPPTWAETQMLSLRCNPWKGIHTYKKDHAVKRCPGEGSALPQTFKEASASRLAEAHFLRWITKVEKPTANPGFYPTSIVGFLESTYVEGPIFRLYLHSFALAWQSYAS